MDFRQSIQINILYDGEEFHLHVPFTATIGKVKDMIHKSIGIPIPVLGQELFHSVEGCLRDEYTLQQYGIIHGSVLVLHKRFKLTINLPNLVQVSRIVCDAYTVGQVKASLVADDGVQEQDIEGMALQMAVPGNRIVSIDDRSYLWAAGIVQDTQLFLTSTNL